MRFVVEHVLDESVGGVFATLFETSAFKDSFHRSQGHQGVAVLDWNVEEGTEAHERVSFFTLNASSASTRCTEQQRFEFSTDRTELTIRSTVRSDGGLFQLSRILTMRQREDGMTSFRSDGDFIITGKSSLPGLRVTLERKMCGSFEKLEQQWLSLATARLKIAASGALSPKSARNEAALRSQEEEEVRRWFEEQSKAARTRTTLLVRWADIHQVDVRAGHKVEWRATVRSGRPVDCSVTFTSASGSVVRVQPSTRAASQSGAHVPAEDGKMTFELDNSFSMFFNKEVLVETVQAPLEETVRERASAQLAQALDAQALIAALLRTLPAEATAAVLESLTDARDHLRRHCRTAELRSPRKERAPLT